MDVLLKTYLRTGILCLGCALPIHYGYAVNYNFPTAGGGTLAVAPQTLVTTDTLTVSSGNFQTEGGISNFTVTLGLGSTVTNNGTISYAGTDSIGKSINANINEATVHTETITNNGTINSGTGLFAIYMANASATAGNTVTINNGGTIIGGVFLNGQAIINLNLNGSASLQGGLTLTPKATTGVSNLNIGGPFGNTLACNFTTNGTIQDITTFTIYSGSTFTLNDAASTVKTLTIQSTGTMNVNATLGGLSAADGAISNAGTMNISSNITKTGTFTTTITGNTIIKKAVTVSTSSYTATAGTHTSLLTDSLNYGNLNLPSTTTAPAFSTFAVSYGGGYFPAGTYTLFTSTQAIGTVPTSYNIPANTTFLTFNTPVVTDANKKIKITITRTPFQTYATTTLTKQIGTSLEQIGGSNPTASMMTVLNAVEACTTPGAVESALRQLAPLTSGPTYGIQMQDQVMQQVELRLAEAKAQQYVAGDVAIQNALWIRGFGDSANQQPIDDSLGYYATTGGTAIGFDRYIDTDFLLGASFSYALSTVRDKINAVSNTKIKSYQAMLYGSYDVGRTRYINWIVAAAANNFDGQRYININSLQTSAISSYSSQIYGVKSVWGNNIAAFDFLQVSPEASLQYTFAKQYEYSETQGGGTNLQVNRQNSNILEGGLGGKIAVPIDLHPGICVPEIHAMGLYNIINGNQTSIATFLGGGTQITSNMNLPRSGIRYGVALTMAVLGRAEIKLNYDHTVMDRYTDNSFYLNFKYIL